MKNFSKIVFSLIIVLALLLSCSGGSSDKSSKQRNFLQIKTSGIGGTWHACGAAWAKIITENSNFIAVNSTSPGLEFETMQKLRDGTVQLGFSGTSTAYFGRIGGKVWADPIDIVALFATQPGIFNVVALDLPGINSLSDLKGKTICTYTEGNYWGDMAIQLLELHDVTQENSRIMRIMKNDSARMLSDGQVDAIFHKYGYGHGTLKQLATARKIKFLAAAPDKMAEYLKLNPFFRTVSFGEEFGVANAEQLVSNYVAIAHGSLPEDIAYLVVKIWFENKDYLMQTLPNIAPWIPWDNPKEDVTIPFHPGAIKYFKEVGLWKD